MLPAGRLGFLQATARHKEPIPAQVPQHRGPSWVGVLKEEPIPAQDPQPCQARGLVAHPTKKGNAALAPDQHLPGQRKEPRDTEGPRGGGCVAAEGHLDGGSGTVATWVVSSSGSGSGSEQDQGSLTAPAEAGTAPVVSSHDKSWI